jgi:hypothetical protein
MEMAVGNQPEIEGSICIQGDGSNVLWQKERLINIAIKRLPKEVRYVCWIDHDIVFENANWLRESIEKIDEGYQCLQPFTDIKYRNRYGEIDRTSKSASSVALSGGTPGTGPGAAWVASREWLDSIGGLYDRNIVGGGDAVWFEAVSGVRTQYRDRQSQASQRHIGQWVEEVGKVRYTCLPHAVQHLWHGEFSNRQYVGRDAIMRRYGFDPDRHVAIDSSGLLAWADAAPQAMQDEVAAYFAGRREDG